MKIEKLNGTAPRLYQLVAPLVMNVAVLRQNNNYPFKTSPRHVWFVVTCDDEVKGFMPVELRDTYACIDNYHVPNGDEALLTDLATRVILEYAGDMPLQAVVHASHVKIFRSLGFSIKKEWKLYVKMIYPRDGNSTNSI